MPEEWKEFGISRSRGNIYEHVRLWIVDRVGRCHHLNHFYFTTSLLKMKVTHLDISSCIFWSINSRLPCTTI